VTRLSNSLALFQDSKTGSYRTTVVVPTFLNVMERPPPPTLAHVEAKEDETDELDAVNMDISLSLLEQLCENEVSTDGPSELDFFTRGASISPSKLPVLKARVSDREGDGEEGDEVEEVDEVDELLMEWTTVLG
jgi:hypothetical protein